MATRWISSLTLGERARQIRNKYGRYNSSWSTQKIRQGATILTGKGF